MFLCAERGLWKAASGRFALSKRRWRFCFDRKIKGYAADGAALSGVESRTSSPVRIIRDDFLQSSVRGIYPCGEGAGYAGGITSAAMDGLKVTESIIKTYRPFDSGGKV